MVYRVGGIDTLMDRGKKIVVLAPDKDATRVALQMAIHKHGSLIDASGTAEWQAELIKAVIQDKVQVSFTDSKLQKRVIEAREIYRQQTGPAQQTSNRRNSGSGASVPNSLKDTALAWTPQELIA